MTPEATPDQQRDCPHCDGLGGHEAGGPICCGNAEWECGASGCTGPIDGRYLTQCEACGGTGRAPDALCSPIVHGPGFNSNLRPLSYLGAR